MAASKINKTEQSKKFELIKEIHQLEIKVKNLEKERGTHIFNKRNDFRKDFMPLEEMDLKMNDERKNEKIKLQQQLNKIRNNVSKFQRELKDIKPTPEFVEKLKVIMEDIEQSVTQFKEQQRLRYDELMTDERTTALEVSALEKRIETWSILPVPEPLKTNRSKPLTSARDVTKDLPPAVAAFEKFLSQTGGHKGGWDEYDHQTFLKFRNKYKGKPIFLKELIPALPTQTEESIIEHETWYLDYLDFNERKKIAIQEWKSVKDAEKEEELLNVEKEQEAEELAERKRAETLRQQIEAEKEERFARLNAWKVQKELEKAQKEEKRLREDLKKAKDSEKDKERQAKIKAQVEEYRKERELEDQIRQQHTELRKDEEERDKKRQLADNARKIKERNDQILNERITKMKSKKEQEEEKQKRLEKARKKIAVPRDPSRLYRLTEGWKERQRTTELSDKTGQVYQMPHRAVPSWRQGLN
ncbi:coiled-coil domain-containing protein 112-like [Tubulanus polymorphus]|uniref:coiled-coil domain-containing protein 112-like n=1 Tax=Tubulanus polymorphus TaxID=672921 RepID=UPI003DA6A08F